MHFEMDTDDGGAVGGVLDMEKVQFHIKYGQ